MPIVYSDGGDNYLGEQKERKIGQWKMMGRELNQSYMYKGFRYFGGRKDQVVVFDNEWWGIQEIARRRANGFLGIKTYVIR